MQNTPVPHIIFMPTVCADMAVAMPNHDGEVVVNGLLFDQMQCCDTKAVLWSVLVVGSQWQPYEDEASLTLTTSAPQTCHKHIHLIHPVVSLDHRVVSTTSSTRKPHCEEGVTPNATRHYILARNWRITTMAGCSLRCTSKFVDTS